MSDNKHAVAIQEITRRAIWPMDRLVELGEIVFHVDALVRDLADAEQQRDYHRDDAAAVRRERDAEINRLAGELAQARARAERWERAARGLAKQYETGITSAEELLAEHGVDDLTDAGEDAP